MPWKNGGGSTIEVAVAPEGAGLDDFDWRISMAVVAADGPFSVFPGIDRTLAILDGNGLDLHGLPRGAVRLQRASAPFAFPADVAVSATLVEGQITDLNVMTRRGRVRSRVRPVRGRAEIGADAATAFLLADDDCVATVGDRAAQNLGPRDALRIDDPGGVAVDIAGRAFLIELLPG